MADIVEKLNAKTSIPGNVSIIADCEGYAVKGGITGLPSGSLGSRWIVSKVHW